MFTYLIINCIFIAAAFTFFRVRLQRPKKAWWYTLGCIFLMTAVFDSLIIWADIVAYDPDKILGLYIIRAPIEDFFYSLLAVGIIPILWKRSTPSDQIA